MKKKIFNNTAGLLVIVLVVLLISSYSSGKVGLNSGGVVPEKKTAKEIVSPDLEIVRKRIIADLLEPAIDGNKINQLVKSIRPDGSWPGINYKDTTKTGFQHSIHLENMLDLARAYKKPGKIGRAHV